MTASRQRTAGTRGTLAAILLAAAVLGGPAATAAHAQEPAPASERRAFDIPAQPLSDAIMVFGRQSGIQVTAGADLVAGRMAGAVSGSLAPVEALNRMLAGTGLTFRFIDAGVVTLEIAPQTSGGTLQLGPVRVAGDAPGAPTTDPNATEGQPGYGTHAMNTATGLSVSPRHTPQSVSIVTRSQLDNEAALTLSDALAHTTGVKVEEPEAWGNSILIRGFSLDTIQINGTNMDFPQQPGLFPFDMAIYDRVEVLRGAAGLTQGAGNPGGTVNLVRKMPTRERQLGVIARGGSWNDYRIEADASGALTRDGEVRARLVGAFQDRDSFTDLIGERKYVAYGVIQADLGETTTVNIGADWTRSIGTPFAWGYPRYEDGGDLGVPRSTCYCAPWNHRESDSTTAFIEIEQQLGGDWKAKLSASRIWASTFNRRLFITGSAVNRETGTGPLVAAVQATFHSDQEIVDLQVDGPFSLFGRRHELVIGANYQKSKGRSIEDNVNDGPWYLTRPNVFTFDPEDYAFPSSIIYDVARSVDVTTQGGFYGLVRFSVSDPIKLFAGMRVNWWHVDYDYASEFYGSFQSYSYKSKGQIVPYGGITVDVSPATTLYASYTDIFQPQNQIDRNGRMLDPIVGRNYEVGVKHGFADDRLLATFALFRIEQVNRSAEDVDGPSPCPFVPGAAYCAIASGKVRNQGLEAELSGTIVPGWQASLGYTLVSTKYANGGNAGARYNIYQPKHVFKLSTAYEFGGALDWLTVGGTVSWQSEFRTEVQGMPQFDMVQKPYALVGLMARAKLTESVSAAVNLNNLFDKRYYKYLSHERAYNYYGDPRSFMITLQGKF